MKTILFDMYFGVGHTYATLKLARLLKDRGHRIIYIGIEKYCRPAVDQGFEFIAYNNLIVPSIKSKKTQKGIGSFFEIMYNTIYGSMIQEAKQNLKEFQKIIKHISPDLIIVDEEHLARYYFYKSLNIPAVSIQTMPDKSPDLNIPPFTSYYCPQQDGIISQIITQFLWKQKEITTRLLTFLLSVKYLGQDKISITKRLLRGNGVKFGDIISYRSSVGFCVKNNPLLILSAVDLDFPRQQKDNIFNIGPLKDVENNNNNTSPRYKALLNKITSRKSQNNNFTVFCSLGTVTFRHKKRLRVFFKKMKKVASLNPDIEFIFSVSEFYRIEEMYPITKNITVFSELPQFDLLKYCDMMITHGGMNSITECIFREIPMLVYPLSTTWDQPGNSARVIFHRLGLRGKIKFDSVRMISLKINRIRTNYSYFEKNIRKMKKKLEENNSSTKAVTIIESFIKNYETQ